MAHLINTPRCRFLSILLAGSSAIGLASCGKNADLLAGSTQGWPAQDFFDVSPHVIPAKEAFAWKQESSRGGETYVWINGGTTGIDTAVFAKQIPNKLAENDSTNLAQLGSPGVLVYFNDNAPANQNQVTLCAAVQGKVTCTRTADAKVVVTELDEKRTSGVVFILSKDRRQRFVVPFDASTPVPAAPLKVSPTQKSENSDEAVRQFFAFLGAAATKDAASMRSLSVPERAHDWDHFGILTSWQRISQSAPKCIASSAHGDVANLWILQTSTKDYPAMPFSVEMSKSGGTWLMSAAHF